MAYVVMDSMREQYGLRPGLEGPFNFAGRVLYYDPKEGKYYDPCSDWYVEHDEMDMINRRISEIIAR